MAELDLPAVLNYINLQTNRKIHYVGHSQGGMIGVIALQNPNVSQLIRKADFLVKLSKRYFNDNNLWYSAFSLVLESLQSAGSFHFTSKSSTIQVHCSIHKKLKVRNSQYQPAYGLSLTEFNLKCLSYMRYILIGWFLVTVNLGTCLKAWKPSLPSYVKIITNYVERRSSYFVVLKRVALTKVSATEA